ncbi:Endoplasmic reticulum mannosyl-oligosaccharide 1,2-alpha-mannosidase [Metarhizium brunneum]|uniref:alpha-1,2-Mannosidase n=1 Tax=Metarhizium brunneum TaxID=500148 RepID=A0A7D5YNV2_9HYPO
MPRRRYRLFTVFSVVIVILLYRVLQNSWDPQPLRPAVVGRPQPPPPPSVPDAVVAAHVKAQFPLKDTGESKPETGHVAQEAADEDSIGAEKLAEKNKNENAEKGAGTKGPSSKAEDAQLKRPSSNNMPQVDSDSTLEPGTKPVQEHDEHGHLQRPLGHGTDDQTTTATTTSNQFAKPTKVHWTKPKEHFPLPKESIITLPTGTAKKIPRIQHVFSPEAEGPKKKRLQRQAKVREQIQRSWAGYRKYAWMHDELLPVSNRSRDPFCGWSATLVDSLDTLWIAGLKDEFDEAAKAAKNIDFTYTNKDRIPVFETTIRYLGGLIAAYDVSGGASGGYSFLLDKAVELAEVLMGIFDTPNRMPLLYYNWRPEYTSQPRRATSAGMAELATLSMEFTRLAQLTAQHKYYDAIDRITNGLIELQKRGTTIPGLFPENLDISGCNRTATNRRDAMSEAAKAQVDSEVVLKPPQGFSEDGADKESTGTSDRTKLDDRLERRALSSLQQDVDAALSADKAPTANNANNAKPQPKSQVPLGADGSKSEWDCVPQGFVPGGSIYESYHMGGSQDSAYEYFGKEYLLLGGKEPKYQKLYEDTIESINKYLLFRPMVQGDWDVIFPARIRMMSNGASPRVEYEVTHLTCFIGGMYALGGKLFGREKDVEYAKKLTDGCVWAYQSTATGIMPEHGQVVPCPNMEKCSFNETLWWQALDPIYRIRDQGVSEWEKNALEREQLEKQKQELEQQIAQMDTEARIEGLEALGEDDGDYGFQRETSTSDSTSTSVSSKSSLLERRAAISVEPENVALISSDGTSSQTTTGKEPSPNDEQTSRKAKSDELDDSDNKQKPSTHPSTKIPTLKNEYHSRPEVHIPQNYPGRSGWPPKPLTHEEFVREKIQEGIPPGYSSVASSKYILRPEAIESVWYMYRITGDSSWMEKGWAMFEATMKATRAPQANSAIDNVLLVNPALLNEMESFWLAETLKYYYLLFSGPDVISLDEWVLNTEAHPFKL